MSTFELKPNQVDHFKRLNNILDKESCCFDTSRLGAGKTSLHLFLAKERALRVFAICPKMTKIVIEEKCEQYKIPKIACISYESMRSTIGHQPIHGYLERIDSKTNEKKKELTFVATKEFKKLVSEGILLLVDEAHKLKNDSAQARAVYALIKEIRQEKEKGGKSRCSLLTGSAVSKKKHVVNLLRLLGYMEHPQLIRSRGGRMPIELLGAKELLEHCKKIDPQRTMEIDSQTGRKKTDIENMCYRLFVDIIKPRILSEMPMRVDTSKIDIKNGHYRMENKEELQELEQAIVQMSKTAFYDWKNKQFISPILNYNAIKQDQMRVENKKVGIFVRLTEKRLQNDALCKVIIFVNFRNTIHMLLECLRKWEPLQLDGSVVKQSDREAIIKKFQADGRLLIAQLKVGGVSLSLDDREGHKKRYTFISPTYDIEDLHQATGRTYRGEETKSKATVRFVYGQTDHRESSILESLMEKTEVLKELLEQQVKDGVLFPSEYPDCTESDDEKEEENEKEEEMEENEKEEK